MTARVIQRLVLPSRIETAELYWRQNGPTPSGRMSPDIPARNTLDLDTYFNSFDENTWCRYTTIGAITAELAIEGAGQIQVWRHTRSAAPALVAEAASSGGTVVVHIPAPPHPRAAGRLVLRIIAGGKLRLHGGTWQISGPTQNVQLMPVICTFDRDGPLIEMLTRLTADTAVCNALMGIVVVNNGRPGLLGRLPKLLRKASIGLLRIVEQANSGGAGGFTRGILEARAIGASHVILMDDDVIIEPEAVFRTLRLYEHARNDLVVAGHMLDLFRPTCLYEGGARLDDTKLAIVPLHLGVPLSEPGSLNRFLDDTPMHYNGWWFMGLPVCLLDRIGLPMPCFIRGDDVEFGRRLHDSGVPMVATAGIGIWHEPFYAKLGSWHVYYEFRNMFVLAACHLPHPDRTLRNVAARWIVAELLMFRYARAALLIRAVEDFLRGPAIYRGDPRALHASLADVRRPYTVEAVSRTTVVRCPEPAIGPRTRAAFAFSLGVAMLREWLRPDGGHNIIAVEPRDHLWFRVRGADAVVVREAWEVDQPLYRRSRKSFRNLLLQTVRLLARMRSLRAVTAAWRDAHAEFTSEAGWRDYLGLDTGGLADCRGGGPRGATTPSEEMAA